MELGFQLKSAELCMTVFKIQLTPHPVWNYVKLEGVHNRNGESAQNRKLLWSPDVLSELFMWNGTQPGHGNGAGIFKVLPSAAEMPTCFTI
ncbi:hypothetical protein BDL97_12G098900 [Sphagnum fallax]|nr:hypothetical protein BDL97_12G098900 [Sphagnum fallax]KAH8946494.1 hypothetical protein BDL97_12G098900 [Sphagnum fallax]KAH8946495.1 hypothetical protein BDL97_12G098900 [Sphagnum fallax]KAH8946496.1 hypothetical protein BDL97_12G098900 [Sphagnum fallax]